MSDLNLFPDHIRYAEVRTPLTQQTNVYLDGKKVEDCHFVDAVKGLVIRARISQAFFADGLDYTLHRGVVRLEPEPTSKEWFAHKHKRATDEQIAKRLHEVDVQLRAMSGKDDSASLREAFQVLWNEKHAMAEIMVTRENLRLKPGSW